MTGTERTQEVSNDGEMVADEVEEENVNPNPYKGVVLMAKTLSGHVVEIKVDQDRPKSFKVQFIPNYVCNKMLGLRIIHACYLFSLVHKTLHYCLHRYL
jgi:hypothetical protein